MNTHRTSNEKERFTEAGEQAARVVSEFLSIASEFSQKFDRGSTDANNSVDKPFSAHRDGQSESHQHRPNQEWQDLAETLSHLREAAGGAMESFANTINQRDTQSRTSNVHVNVAEANVDLAATRQQELSAVFSDRKALESLSDEQFQQLLNFVRSNYESALELVQIPVVQKSG